MSAFVNEWLNLALRWMHVLGAIAWIGHAFMFNWLDTALTDLEEHDDAVQGELWMVHGGGFYHVKKYLQVPSKVLDILHWFKWEATFTWVTGICLLGVVYYMGGGLYLVDPNVSSITVGQASLIGVGTLVGSFTAYHLIMISPIGKMPSVSSVVLVIGTIGISYALAHVLSGRAAYIHIGAMFGTVMFANVWTVILPMHHQLIEAMRKGEKADPAKAFAAKQRSKHNNYLAFPVVFIMISNHFTHTYGNKLNWVLLALLLVTAGAIKYVMNVKDKLLMPMLTLAAVCISVALYMTAPKSHAPPPAPATPSTSLQAIDPNTVGSVVGKVSFEGTPPARKVLPLIAGCDKAGEGPVYLDNVLVNNGALQNVFVSIQKGQEKWKAPTAPSQEIVVDQRGCRYAPRILGARVGQKVTFLNSDSLFHNVRSIAKSNETFNLLMPTKDQRITRTFLRPEIMVTAKCDVHPWMTAQIGVVDHPWFAVTDASGGFILKGVPPGKYTINFWHEVFGQKNVEVTVPSSGQATANATFTAAK